MGFDDIMQRVKDKTRALNDETAARRESTGRPQITTTGQIVPTEDSDYNLSLSQNSFPQSNNLKKLELKEDKKAEARKILDVSEDADFETILKKYVSLNNSTMTLLESTPEGPERQRILGLKDNLEKAKKTLIYDRQLTSDEATILRFSTIEVY